MMTFQVRPKRTRKPNQPRLRFDLEKLRDPDVACTFQATIGGKFAPLIGLSDEDMDMDMLAVPRRLFCFGSLVILDVARCYLWLFTLYI